MGQVYPPIPASTRHRGTIMLLMPIYRRPIFPLLLLALVVGCGAEPSPDLSFDGEWRQWRGSTRDGHVRHLETPVESWPETFGLVWRQKLGPGFSSVAVSGGRLLTLEADGGQEWLIALDAQSGTRLWRQSVGERYESAHGDGPRSTPAIANLSDSRQVAVGMGALGGLVAVDVADGAVRWRHDLMQLSGGDREDWGFASSPLIDDGRVYLHGAEGVTALALDLDSGEILWQLDEGPGGYASPMLVELGGRRQLLSFLGAGLYGLDPANGDVLWRYEWTTYYDLNAADPAVISPTEVFFSSNYATGAGFVEWRDSIEPTLRWENSRVRLHWSSPLILDGLIYGFDKTFLVAVDPTDGTVLWKQRGFGEGSLLAVDGQLLVLGEQGTVAVGDVSRQGWTERRRYEELVRGPVRASPVLVGGRLFMRGEGELVAFDVSAPPG